MRKVNKSWMAVVAAALLLGTVAGVVWASPKQSHHATVTTRRVTLTGADFIQAEFNSNCFYEPGNVHGFLSRCFYTAPVQFPWPGAVTVERINVHVKDGNTADYAQAELWRADPSTGANGLYGTARSPDGTSGGLQTYTSADINKVVWPSQEAFIWLYVGIKTRVYGVTVEYHVNTQGAEASSAVE